ncbi:MAG: NAD(P)H-binding protein [Phycisphaeraceae bacterium]|nr:NAD(P)H-binding protein [Phycisphaeraceae bacterium]
MGLTVAVAGASGFVGSAVVGELLGRGHRVRALVRDPARSAKTLPSHASMTLVTGSLGESDALASLVDGCDACVNTVGIIRERPDGQSFQRIHVRGVRALVEACRTAHVDRFVQISAVGVSDEGVCAYQRSKFEGEMLVRQSGLSWTVLRLGLVHGPNGEFMRMARGWVTGKSAPHLFIPYFRRLAGGPPVPGLARLEDPKAQPVHVDDVAWAVAESLSRDASVGEVIDVVGPETVTMPDILRELQSRVPLAKKGLRLVPMPDKVGACVARTAGALGLGQALPFDEGMARMAGRDSTGNRERARSILGFAPRPCISSIREYAPSM